LAKLDVARKYHPKEFLIEMCSYLSFYKQNILHLHLSDNLYNNVNVYTLQQSKELYSAFRLSSDNPALSGLVRRPRESYSRDDFEEIQRKCARRGVTIIPELEAPGHAMSITQWKPQLALSSDFSLLNISHPETLPTMKAIWGTFLPWMHSKTVSIGADEYDTNMRSEYNMFVNEMRLFISTNSSKQIRIWGTFPYEANQTNVEKDVSIQHWEKFFGDPLRDYIQNNYDVLNSDDFFYLVGKWDANFPQKLNLTRIFFGNPDGGPYAPYVFDHLNNSNNPLRDNPHVLGHVVALWNNLGPNGTTVSETYYALRDGLPGIADKQWGGDLLLEEYGYIFDTLHSAIPAQNLDLNVATKTDTILKYTLSEVSEVHVYKISGQDRAISMVKDLSGNGYDGVLHNFDHNPDETLKFNGFSYISTPLDSKGRDYTLSFSVKPTSSIPGVLFSGSETELVNGNGTISNLTVLNGGNAFSLNYTLPLHHWSDISLVGKGNATYLSVITSGKLTSMEFITKVSNIGVGFVWVPMAFEAPLAKIGEGFRGQMKDIIVKGGS
jgi:hexosaminidase